MNVNIFRVPTPRELAELELEEAERALLRALTAESYAKALSQHHTAVISRLRDYLETNK